MSTVVLDTDVASFLFKGDRRAMAYEAHLKDSTWAVSFMTVAELDRWSLAHRWGHEKRRRLSEFLDRCLICHSTRELCQIWAGVLEEARRRGFVIGSADAWIAAVAISLDAPLATHNRDDYRGIDALKLAT